MFGLLLAAVILIGMLCLVNGATAISMLERGSPEAVGGCNSLFGTVVAGAAFVCTLVALCLL